MAFPPSFIMNTNPVLHRHRSFTRHDQPGLMPWLSGNRRVVDLGLHKGGHLREVLVELLQIQIAVLQLIGVNLSLSVQSDYVLTVLVRTVADAQDLHPVSDKRLGKWRLV